ncbi:MAG: GNAT family N-acetyltransferase [Planctomycetota bacterium]|nr:GNAT family N-acetyltransferase [Planctomycetota bacterium]
MKRIEREECALLRDCCRAIAARRSASDTFTMEIGGGVATYSGEGSPLNKVAGLGFDGDVDEAALERVERAYAERGAGVLVELSTHALPSVGKMLTDRGYALAGFENVLGRRLENVESRRINASIDVRESHANEAAAWLDVVVSGFMTPDTQGVASHEQFDRSILEGVIGDMAGANGMRRFLATREGAVAGGGSLRLGEGVAHLCGAATLPAHRRRGVQTALLAARLAFAREAGCELAVVTTLPGSKSHQNVRRHGFEVLYVRAALVKEAEA